MIMADEASKSAAPSPAPPPAAPKAKIKLLFHKAHTHTSAAGVERQYKPGDKDMFTQEEADLIRAQRTAETIVNF
jgi:hypothetical protein